MKHLFLLTLSVIIFSACQNTTPKENSTTESSEEAGFKLTELWRTDTIMQTPESVLYDAENGILYVANMHLATEEDDGFISKLNTNGTVIELEWLTGLKAPKGMGIVDEKLFATDVDELAIIDIESATLLEKIPVDGAAFLNDLAIGEDKLVYFSDSKTGKIHIYKEGEIEEWITEGLSRPNGLYIKDGIVMLSSSGSNDVRSIDIESKEMTVVATGIGAGDGLEYTGIDDYFLVSDWNGEIFIIGNDTIQSLLKTKDIKINSADIGFNKAEQIVYVPTFFNNRVVAYKLLKE